jgi:hypothetical protein
MSHPNPHHDPENERVADSKFASKAKSKALKKAYTKKEQANIDSYTEKPYKNIGAAAINRQDKHNARNAIIAHFKKNPITKKLRRGPPGMYN